jgi:hypothetical protein
MQAIEVELLLASKAKSKKVLFLLITSNKWFTPGSVVG